MKTMSKSLISIAALMTIIGCRSFCEPFPDRLPPALCTEKVKFSTPCPGKIMNDGVISCYVCFKTDNKIFPGDEDLITSCIDGDRNHYCVDISGCSDMDCRSSVFGAKRPADMCPMAQPPEKHPDL